MANRGYFHISEPTRSGEASSDKKRTKLVPVSALMAIVLFFLLFGIYSVRVCPVLPVGDSGELATAAFTGGVAHPPGYPIFTMLGHIFTSLNMTSPTKGFPDGTFDVAYRMNVMAMWFGILTVMVVYFILARALKNPFAAFLGAFLFGTGATFLSQSLVGEVYTLNALITALIIFELVLIDEKPTPWRLVGLAFLFGLGLAHHTSILALLIPTLVFLFLTFVIKRVVIKKSLAYTLLIFFAIGLLPYLYLPIASSQNPYLDYGDPDSFMNFFKVVTRSEYQSIKAGIQHTDESLGFSRLAGAYNRWQMNSYGRWFVLFGYLGLLVALVKGKRLGLMLALAYFFFTVPYFIYFRNITRYDLFYLEVYYIPAHLVFALFIGYFFFFALESLPRLIRKIGHQFLFATLIFVLLIVMTVGFYRSHGAGISMKDHTIGSRFAYDILRGIPQDSILITDGDDVFLFWYMQQVAEIRKDVVVLENQALKNTRFWWWDSIKRDYPELVIPQPEANDAPMTSGLFTDALLLMNPSRKIFFTSFAEDFKPSTDRTTIVPDGIIYEYGFKSTFKSPYTLDSELANFIFNPELDFTTEGLDDYEELVLDKYVRAYYNYGNYFLKANRMPEAIDMLTNAYELNPAFDPGNGQYPPAGIIALLYLRQQDWANASKTLTRLIDSGKADSVWYYLKAYSLIKLQDIEGARLVADKAHKRDKNNQFINRLLGYLSRPVNELINNPSGGEDQLVNPENVLPSDS